MSSKKLDVATFLQEHGLAHHVDAVSASGGDVGKWRVLLERDRTALHDNLKACGIRKLGERQVLVGALRRMEGDVARGAAAAESAVPVRGDPGDDSGGLQWRAGFLASSPPGQHVAVGPPDACEGKGRCGKVGRRTALPDEAYLPSGSYPLLADDSDDDDAKPATSDTAFCSQGTRSDASKCEDDSDSKLGCEGDGDRGVRNSIQDQLYLAERLALERTRAALARHQRAESDAETRDRSECTQAVRDARAKYWAQPSAGAACGLDAVQQSQPSRQQPPAQQQQQQSQQLQQQPQGEEQEAQPVPPQPLQPSPSPIAVGHPGAMGAAGSESSTGAAGLGVAEDVQRLHDLVRDDLRCEDARARANLTREQGGAAQSAVALDRSRMSLERPGPQDAAQHVLLDESPLDAAPVTRDRPPQDAPPALHAPASAFHAPSLAQLERRAVALERKGKTLEAVLLMESGLRVQSAAERGAAPLPVPPQSAAAELEDEGKGEGEGEGQWEPRCERTPPGATVPAVAELACVDGVCHATDEIGYEIAAMNFADEPPDTASDIGRFLCEAGVPHLQTVCSGESLHRWRQPPPSQPCTQLLP